jgi:peptidoglycan DL-endopeptidase CwlO
VARARSRIPRMRRPLYHAVVGAATVMALVLVGGAQAHAEPSVAEIEKQINDLWAEAEPAIEQYNHIHSQFKTNRAKQVALEKQIAPLRRQVELAQARVGVMAAQVYKGTQANALNAMITSGSPEDFIDQLSVLDQLARDQQRQLSGVTTTMTKYQKQKQPIDELVAKLAAQDAELALKKKQIETRLTQLQALRIKAYGSTSTLGALRPWPCPSSYLPTAGYKAAKHACSQIGDPYVWAAEGPNSYDCSGLTLAAWKTQGVYLPHNAAQQRKSMPYVTKANLQIGDLVFYYSNLRHVGIYVGNGKVVHAPTFGDKVRMADMNAAGSIHSYGRPSG